MPQVGWIDALRRWNAGMPSWCIPRKGTPGYESVMRIRRGDEVETPKQIMDRMERKTVGKSKVEKRTMTISLDGKGGETMETPKAKTVLKKREPKVETREEKLAKLEKEYSRAHMAVSDHKKGTKAYKEAVAKRDALLGEVMKMRD